jgi:hypothetical protein
MWREGIIDHTEPGMYMSATADSNGLAQDFLGPVSAGYVWYVERWTAFSATAATTPVVELFVQSAERMPTTFTAAAGDRQGRQDLSITADNDAADLNSPIYIPEGYYLVAFWSGLTSGDVVQLSTQIAVHLVGVSRTEPLQLEVQQTEGTPDIDTEEVAAEDGIITELEHATADLMRGIGKVV